MPKVKPNWPLLAGLRFVLALIVAMTHISLTVADGTFAYYRHWGAGAAVAAFLVVSGFCMAHSYGREPEGFYRRRFWRIWPTYAFAVIVAQVPFWVWGHNIAINFQEGFLMPPWPQIARAFFMVPFAHDHALPFDGALWTVNVEAFYYLLVPFMARLRSRHLVPLIGISAATARLTPLDPGYWLYGHLFWAFGIGWLLFHHWRDRRVRALALILPPAMVSGDGVLASLVALGAVFLILNMERCQFEPKLAARLNYLGDLSYPLYALHWPVAWIITLLYLPVDLAQPAFVVWICVAAAAVVLHAVDKPLRRLGREPLWRRRTVEVATEGAV